MTRTFAPPKPAVVTTEDTRRYREGRHENCPSCIQYKPVNCHQCGVFLNREGECPRGHQFKQNCMLCGRWLRKDGTCTQLHGGLDVALKGRLYDAGIITEDEYKQDLDQ